MCAPVSAGHRVDLVDDDHAKVAKQPSRRAPRRDQHHLQRFRGGHQDLGGLGLELLLFAVRDVAVPHEPPQANHVGVGSQTFFLVVQQRLDGRDVDQPGSTGRLIHQRRDGRED
jgi:hypothetical protein